MTVLDSLSDEEWADAVRDAASYPAQVPDTKVQTLIERQGQQAA